MANGPADVRTENALIARLGLTDEPGKGLPYLRALLAFAAEMPGVGPFLKGTSAALKELAQEEEASQLEKRLFSLGLQTRSDIAALTDLAQVLFLQQNALMSLIERSEFPLRKEQLTEFAMQTALIAYRSNVARDNQYADHRGIEGSARVPAFTSPPLDDVYVTPTLIHEDGKIESTDQEIQILKSLFDNRDLTSEQKIQLEEKYAALAAQRWSSESIANDGRLLLGGALGSVRRIVVIGVPGVGKSLLTRYLARACALGPETMKERLGWAEDLIPIVISLASYAEAQEKCRDLTIRSFLDQIMTERGGDVLHGAISEELKEGKTFVMLDGVDEVPNSRARAAVVQAIEAFISTHFQNRILITSRPYGYIPIAGDVSHFRMPNFSPDQVEDFIYKWRRAFEQTQHPDAPDFDDARIEADKLLLEIRRNPKVAELATNPLMLVVISLIGHERARLPEERVQLYNRALATLMDTWNQWRSALGGRAGGTELPLSRAIRVWGAVAEWAHRTKPTGVIHRAELKRELVRVLREGEFDEFDPEATADSYLDAAVHRAGLLEERGPDIFAFWHPSFQEYLAAVELSTPTSKAIQRLLPLRDDPRWRETILLAVGYIGIIQRDEETATELVRAIADQEPSPFEELFHRNLRLAAACAAEDVGVKRTVTDELICRMANALHERSTDRLASSLISTVWALPFLRPSSETISALARIAVGAPSEAKAAAVRLLINSLGDPIVRAVCEQLIDDSYRWASFGAAIGLATTGDYRPEIWKALAGIGNGSCALPGTYMFIDQAIQGDHTRLHNEQKYFLARSPKEVFACLRSGLDSEDRKLRLAAAWLLHDSDGELPGSVRALLSCLTSPDLDVRFEAARMLLQIGTSFEECEKALTECATEADYRLCIDAAYLLFQRGRLNHTLRAQLFAWVDSSDRPLAIEALALVEQAKLIDDGLVEKLFHWLDDDTHAITALSSLFRIGTTNKPVAGRLILWLQESGLSSQSLAIRHMSCRWLVEMSQTNGRLIESLTCLLRTMYRSDALRDLSRLGSPSEELVCELQKCLAESDGFEEKLSVARELCNLGQVRLAVETVVKMFDPQSGGALAGFQRLIERKPITGVEARQMVELVSARNDDNDLQKKARAWLFDWLGNQLERK